MRWRLKYYDLISWYIQLKLKEGNKFTPIVIIKGLLGRSQFTFLLPHDDIVDFNLAANQRSLYVLNRKNIKDDTV